MPEMVCPQCGGGFPPTLLIADACPWCGQLLIFAEQAEEGEEGGVEAEGGEGAQTTRV